MYVFMCVHTIYQCLHLGMYIGRHPRVYLADIYVCTYLHILHTCMHTYMCECISFMTQIKHAYTYIYIHMYGCIYVSMYILIHICM